MLAPIASVLLALTSIIRYGGLTNPEIGSLMGVDYSTVSQGRKRLREKVEKDEELRQIYERLRQQCQGYR